MIFAEVGRFALTTYYVSRNLMDRHVQIQSQDSPVKDERLAVTDSSLFARMPEECILDLFTQLSFKEAAALSATCTLFHRISKDRSLKFHITDRLIKCCSVEHRSDKQKKDVAEILAHLQPELHFPHPRIKLQLQKLMEKIAEGNFSNPLTDQIHRIRVVINPNYSHTSTPAEADFTSNLPVNLLSIDSVADFEELSKRFAAGLLTDVDVHHIKQKNLNLLNEQPFARPFVRGISPECLRWFLEEILKPEYQKRILSICIKNSLTHMKNTELAYKNLLVFVDFYKNHHEEWTPDEQATGALILLKTGYHFYKNSEPSIVSREEIRLWISPQYHEWEQLMSDLRYNPEHPFRAAFNELMAS